MPKCTLCGDDKDVITTLEHVGGKGDFEPVTQCRNKVGCWRRWSQINGIDEPVGIHLQWR